MLCLVSKFTAKETKETKETKREIKLFLDRGKIGKAWKPKLLPHKLHGVAKPGLQRLTATLRHDTSKKKSQFNAIKSHEESGTFGVPPPEMSALPLVLCL